MLNGTYHYQIDRKGRVVIPGEFRQELGPRFVLARAPQQTVLALPLGMWSAAVTTGMGSQNRDYFVSGAVQCCPHPESGRVQLTYPLRQHLGAKRGEPLVLAGLGNVAVL